jgi:2-hydroxychromene-2-carboxylate isomerase
MAERPALYFDFTSPYAYLACERIDDLIPDAEWRPFAYPIVLRQRGRLEEVLQRDPATILETVLPRASARGLPPIAPPPGWPFETWSLTPLRAAMHAEEHGRVKEFSRAAFRKVFVESRLLADLETIRAVAEEAGLDPDEAVEAVERPEIKDRLKERTDEAFARGVDGIPTVAVGDQLFWGDDHLEEAAAAARGH